MSVDRVLDLVVAGLVNGSQYGLLGSGFALIFGVTGRFHYAFAFVFTASAYVVAILQEATGLPFLVLALLAVLVAAGFGVLCEVVVYHPLARSASAGLTLLIVFVAALGVTVAGENAISLLFGPQSRALEQIGSHQYTIGGVRISALEVTSVLLAWALVGALAAALRWTDPGRVVRAVRGNPDLASVTGIRVDRVYLWVFAAGSMLAAVGAIVSGLRFAVTPGMGTRPVVFAFVVAFLGGTHRSPLTVGLAGLALGLVESLSGIWLSTQWASLVVFSVLFLYLSAPAISLPALRRRLPASLEPQRGAS